MDAKKTFTSQFSEQTTIAVLGKYKGRGVMLTNLHEKINQSLDLIEAQIIASPDTKALQHLYLATLALYNRSKGIAQIKIAYMQDGKKMEATETASVQIQADEHWTCSVTKSGKVRVHLTAEGKAFYAAEFEKDKQVLSYKFY